MTEHEHGAIPWKTVPLGEIAEIKLGKMLDRAKHTTGHRLPYLRNINIRWGATTDDLLEMYFEKDQLDRFGIQVLGVDVLDHIIVAASGFVSMKQRGFL